MKRIRAVYLLLLAVFLAIISSVGVLDGITVFAKDELKEARQCTFVVPSEFTLQAETGIFINKNEPMESSSISYDIYDNGKKVTLTNREKKMNPASIEKAAIDNTSNLTKSEYEKLLSDSYNDAFGSDVDFKVESFENITVDGYPGYHIESSFMVPDQQKAYQTVYMILSKYKTFTITYQRAEDDKCQELFEQSAATIHVN
ncbi:hypothetical protein SAMN04487928_12831 [Butyrivibrio proteoclasticus]|uniref:Uncharacterized protein n=1 Tax=Butyrivibrio proteoclasticus TaxID=43305 RepID=A0A1I5X5F9_9FIRM|nr:hypothetical protein [Butyrivibrio proteoclasticus]SFQ27235.1 hypothetical protein SAMN04487928_12831 [Butyrivibrio proteoclasticus]